MIELAIDGQCYSCPNFEVEDTKTILGDHMIMCANRKKCYTKRQAVLDSCMKNMWVERPEGHLEGGRDDVW
jgi:hypothetical protein